MNVIKTTNTSFGFYGTIADANINVDAAWDMAFRKIAARTAAEANDVRAFLDSRFGRHFADSVINCIVQKVELAEAIDLCIAQWCSWKTSAADARRYGIPRGTNYLTGHVISAGLFCSAD